MAIISKRKESPFGCLSSNTLKLIACLAMMVDHIGLVAFPTDFGFRMVGRLAFPLFAFFIAEGCHYTGRKARRFLIIFSFGLFYLVFFRFMSGIFYANIFLTFSASILMIYALDYAKESIFSDRGVKQCCVSVIIFALTLIAFYTLDKLIEFDYGFIGMMIPVAVSLFDFKDLRVPKYLSRLDNYLVRIIMLTAGLIVLYFGYEHIFVYIFSFKVSIYVAYFLVPVILLFYNGRIGKYRMKYFFYAFYPIHLVLIYAIYMLFVLFK